MNPTKKQTQKKNLMLLIGISLSLAILFSGVEAATVDNKLIQPLSFNSIVTLHNLINVDGIAFMLGNTKKDNKDTDTTTTPTADTQTSEVKSEKKIVTYQKNSTSRRNVIIDD